MGCVRMMKLESFADMNGRLAGIAILVTVIKLLGMKLRTKKTLPRQGFFRILAGTISGEPSIAWSILRTFRPGLSP